MQKLIDRIMWERFNVTITDNSVFTGKVSDLSIALQEAYKAGMRDSIASIQQKFLEQFKGPSK